MGERDERCNVDRDLVAFAIGRERLEPAMGSKARIVHEQIDAHSKPCNFGHDGVHGSRKRKIGDDDFYARAVQRADLCRKLIEALAAARDENEIVDAVGEPQAEFVTESRRSTGDKRNRARGGNRTGVRHVPGLVIVKLLPILGITFIDILGFSILIPLMPYFVKNFGAPDIVVGALFATFAFCQFVGGPVWGNVSDRAGRKTVLVISQIGATIGWTMLAFAPNIGIVFVARIIEGFSGGNISVTQAYVSDLVEPAKRGRAFSYIGAAFSAGLVFGPLAGGFLVAKYGYATPFLLAAGLQVVTLIVTILVLPESRKASDEKPATLADIKHSLADPRIAPVMWQKLVFSLGLYGWFSVFTLVLAQQFGFDASGSSYFFCAFGLASIVFQVGVVGRLTDALGDRRTSNIGFVALLIGFGIVPFAHTIPLAVIMVVFFSFGLSLVQATIPSMLSANAPDNQRGTVLGAASSLESASGIIMPVLSTYTLQAAGVTPTIAITFGLTTLALIMGLAAMRAKPAAAI